MISNNNDILKKKGCTTINKSLKFGVQMSYFSILPGLNGHLFSFN